MAEVNAKDLTTKTDPASTDSMLLFGTSTNEGAKITVDNLANNILERLTTKTFANQVGGSSAATILAQLATLNSNTFEAAKTWTAPIKKTENIDVLGGYVKVGKLVVVNISIRYDVATTAPTDLLGFPAPYQAAIFCSASTTNGAKDANYYLTQSGILRCYDKGFSASSVRYAITGAYFSTS